LPIIGFYFEKNAHKEEQERFTVLKGELENLRLQGGKGLALSDLDKCDHPSQVAGDLRQVKSIVVSENIG
jgi:hypothetical protein